MQKNHEPKLDKLRDYVAMGTALAGVLGKASPYTAGATLLATGASRILKTSGWLKDSRTPNQQAAQQHQQALEKAFAATIAYMDTPEGKLLAQGLEPYVSHAINTTPGTQLSHSKFEEMAARLAASEARHFSPAQIDRVYTIFTDALNKELRGREAQQAHNLVTDTRLDELEQNSGALAESVSQAEQTALQARWDIRELRGLYDTLAHTPQQRFFATLGEDITPTTHFTGREELLQQLEERVKQGGRLMLVSGMGGIGKTHLCRKLCQQIYSRWQRGAQVPVRHIAYFTYDENSTLDDILYLGLGLAHTRAQDDETPDMQQEYARMWRLLHTLAEEGLLLCMDNVPVALKSEELIPLCRLNCAVVLTSRRPEVKSFESIPVDRLPLEDCVKIFRQINTHVQDEELPLLRQIIKQRADCHTLTIDRFAYISLHKDWTMQQLEDALAKDNINIHYSEEGDTKNLIEQYAKLYSMDVLTPGEQNILAAFSLMPDAPIPAEWCKEWFLPDAQEIDPSVTDESINRLHQKGWLAHANRSYHLHTVYAQVVRHLQPPGVEGHTRLLDILWKKIRLPHGEIYTSRLQYLPYAESLLHHLQGIKHEYISILAYAIGYLYKEKRDPEAALPWLLESLQIEEALYGKEHPNCIAPYGCIGTVYNKMERYDEALQSHLLALKIAQTVPEKKAQSYPLYYHNIAASYSYLKQFDRALEYWELALQSIGEQTNPNQHLIGTVYNSMALSYEDWGKHPEALKYAKKALDLRLDLYGLAHPDTAYSYYYYGFLESRNKKTPPETLAEHFRLAYQGYCECGFENDTFAQKSKKHMERFQKLALEEK